MDQLPDWSDKEWNRLLSFGAPNKAYIKAYDEAIKTMDEDSARQAARLAGWRMATLCDLLDARDDILRELNISKIGLRSSQTWLGQCQYELMFAPSEEVRKLRKNKVKEAEESVEQEMLEIDTFNARLKEINPKITELEKLVM
jgi:hypothetical protein